MTESQKEVISLIGGAKDVEEAVRNLQIVLDCIEFLKQNGADEAKANEWLKEKYGVELISEREEAEA